MTLADRILSFQKELKIKARLPKGVEVMNPYKDSEAAGLCEKFYRKFYSDNNSRTMILGINPGRFGGGITGIPFTDPEKLESLDITNELPKKRELSADFIYSVIDACGGPKRFYGKFYVSAISPLGFVMNDKNLNYYDVKGLPNLLEEFIVMCMKEQMGWGLNSKMCYCLGESENFKFLQKLNGQFGFFNEITPLPHPRFIMQYRRKSVNKYIDLYKQKMEM